ncbi:NAD(P)-dependent oxidoreductase [Dactylosporangium matsuzakiense]|uniref:NAD(P)-dependent oxidoreductase n=1 Tax=Dactylosporangium matsuzakiense TaxID=53360 RepID=UPI0021C461E3|nr:NAD(P)-binding oxidoreductase [Dactylosporangium matsuzakiense]UWZ47449.1 SDR family oxidoreductase [Dactylosporangium matsuzakiense]
MGATGGTGRELIRQALSRGHRVRAVARTPSRLTSDPYLPADHPDLTVITADVLDPAALKQALGGAEIIVSALGITSGDPSAAPGPSGPGMGVAGPGFTGGGVLGASGPGINGGEAAVAAGSDGAGSAGATGGPGVSGSEAAGMARLSLAGGATLGVLAAGARGAAASGARVVWLSALGVGPSATAAGFLTRALLGVFMRKELPDRVAATETVLAAGGTVVHAGPLSDGPLSASRRILTLPELPRSLFPARVSRATVAAAMLDEVESGRFIGRPVVVVS